MNTGSIIALAVIAGIFVYLWQKGHLLRFTAYVQDTQVELKKCTWPTFDELKGSTMVVLVSALLLGGFTVLVDFGVSMLLKFLRV